MALYKFANSKEYFYSAHYKDEGRKQNKRFSKRHFRRGFYQNYRQETKNKVSTSYKTVLSSKIFPKHDLVRSYR